MKQELIKRILSSIILLPITFFSIIKGSFLFILFILICLAVSMYEWNMMSKKKSYRVYGFIFLFFSFYTIYKLRIDIDDYWFDRIVVDPVIYLNFMQLKCSYKLGYSSDDAKALSDIEQTIVRHLSNRDLAHLETALNILGHCYLNKGWSRLALQCYKVSWTIRPLHNAAKWHVMFLIFGNILLLN